MTEPGDPLGTNYEVPAKQRPWGVIAAIVAFVLVGVLVFWITREKKSDQVRQEVVSALDKELGAEEELIKAQREKVMDLTRQVETLRSSIQVGQVKNGKAAVAQFNQLAAEQRAERDKFTKMAEEYNKKVAEYRKLSE